jgi:hypothetical protein
VSTATGVTLKDVLPAGLSYVSDDGVGSYSSGTGIWTVGTLTPGASKTLHVTATVATPGTKTNYVQVTTAGQVDVDSTPNNNSGPTPVEDDEAAVSLTPPSNPRVDIEKTTSGPSNTNGVAADYDNEDSANGAGVPVLTSGTSVTWTYKVTNTGNVAFTAAQVVVTDDSGTPGNSADDLSTTTGTIVLVPGQASAADGVLSPGEVWLYRASGTVQALPSTLGSAVTIDLSGSSALSGAAGNVRTFSAGGVSVKAKGFSRDKATGAWASGYLGSYGGGLGVTDGSEGSGSNNTHVVDNVGGRDNFVLFAFDQSVAVDSAFLGYVVGDSDLRAWIGTLANAFASPPSLSDATLTGLGFTELNAGGGSTRLADLNAGNIAGNVLVIAAKPGESDDQFKIEKLKLRAATPGVYENKGTVIAPGAPSDFDLSHYKNPASKPSYLMASVVQSSPTLLRPSGFGETPITEALLTSSGGGSTVLEKQTGPL